jgi:hypothetical protein
MTVCESSVLAASRGKDPKRDVRRPQLGATVTFVAMGRRALLHTAEPLYTQPPLRGRNRLPQVGRTGLFEPLGRFLTRGMRAATALSDGDTRTPDFCQIGARGI